MHVKNSNKNKYFFNFTFSHRYIDISHRHKYFHFVRKRILKNLAYIVTFSLQFFQVAGYWKGSNKTATPIQICIGFVDAVLRPKILGNRLGILTWTLIAMNCCFFLYISEK